MDEVEVVVLVASTQVGQCAEVQEVWEVIFMGFRGHFLLTTTDD